MSVATFGDILSVVFWNTSLTLLHLSSFQDSGDVNVRSVLESQGPLCPSHLISLFSLCCSDWRTPDVLSCSSLIPLLGQTAGVLILVAVLFSSEAFIGSFISYFALVSGVPLIICGACLWYELLEAMSAGSHVCIMHVATVFSHLG